MCMCVCVCVCALWMGSGGRLKGMECFKKTTRFEL